MKDAFIKLDVNGDGVLSKDELKKGFAEIPDCVIPDGDWEKLISVLDINKNGKIDYTEFIAGCM